MPDFKVMLTKKLGPLPAYGWGIVIGGGYIAYRYLSGKGLSLSGGSSAATTATDSVGDSSTYATGSGSVASGYGDYVGGVDLTGQSTLITSLRDQLTGTQNDLNAAKAADAKDKTALEHAINTNQHNKDRAAAWKAYAQKEKKAAYGDHKTTVKKTPAKAAKAPKAKGTQGTHTVVPIKSARTPGQVHRKPIKAAQ
jgi:hypothetical protein